MAFKDKIGIMVHCLDTPRGWRKDTRVELIVDEVRNWHVRERGWSDLAYAEIIHCNGDYAPGRDLNNDGSTWDDTGAGAKGFNKEWIHIALNGGKGGHADDEFLDNFTVEQGVTLRARIDAIQLAAGRPLKVIGHNDVSNKQCPCFDAKRWYAQKPPRQVSTSKTIMGAVASVLGTGAVAAAPMLPELPAGLDPDLLIALGGGVAVAAAILIIRERLRYWKKGVK